MSNPRNDPAATGPDCEGCPFNTATYLARNGDLELRLCECCAQAHDEADGWTITPIPPQTSQDPKSTIMKSGPPTGSPARR